MSSLYCLNVYNKHSFLTPLAVMLWAALFCVYWRVLSINVTLMGCLTSVLFNSSPTAFKWLLSAHRIKTRAHTQTRIVSLQVRRKAKFLTLFEPKTNSWSHAFYSEIWLNCSQETCKFWEAYCNKNEPMHTTEQSYVFMH